MTTRLKEPRLGLPAERSDDGDGDGEDVSTDGESGDEDGGALMGVDVCVLVLVGWMGWDGMSLSKGNSSQRTTD